MGDGPYAKRSCLGWCIIGPIAKMEAMQSVNCNTTRVVIPVKDTSSGQVANHYFTTKNSIQDTLVTTLLKQMYSAEFNEVTGEKKALSVEDERFLAILNSRVRKIDGHYEVPLLFRDDNLYLPNRLQAVKRLISLKRKFETDNDYQTQYVCIVEAWIAKGYARRADTSYDVTGKVWFTPHFGVYNKEKGKWWVVQDYSVRYTGRCLNDELLQGPDMINSLTGVLLRFRKEPVAIMGDIEAMYHQVFVPESQRCFLGFLWWPDGNILGS